MASRAYLGACSGACTGQRPSRMQCHPLGGGGQWRKRQTDEVASLPILPVASQGFVPAGARRLPQRGTVTQCRNSPFSCARHWRPCADGIPPPGPAACSSRGHLPPAQRLDSCVGAAAIDAIPSATVRQGRPSRGTFACTLRQLPPRARARRRLLATTPDPHGCRCAQWRRATGQPCHRSWMALVLPLRRPMGEPRHGWHVPRCWRAQAARSAPALCAAATPRRNTRSRCVVELRARQSGPNAVWRGVGGARRPTNGPSCL